MRLMAAPNETLWDHLNVALVFYKHIYVAQGYGALLFRRAVRLGLDVPGGLKGDLNVLPQLAILLHDLGKAYEPLQGSVRERGTASHHEYVSVAAASRMLRLDGLGGDARFLRDSILLSIVWHHTAMRGSDIHERRSWLADVYRRYSSDRKYVFRLEEAGELRWIMDTLAKTFNLHNYLDVDSLPGEITLDDVNRVSSSLVEELRDRERGLKLYAYALLILHPLMVCDNYSANTNRMGRLTRFLADLPTPRETVPIRDALRRLVRKPSQTS